VTLTRVTVSQNIFYFLETPFFFFTEKWQTADLLLRRLIFLFAFCYSVWEASTHETKEILITEEAITQKLQFSNFDFIFPFKICFYCR